MTVQKEIEAAAIAPIPIEGTRQNPMPATTGRYVVIYKQGASDSATIQSHLSRIAGIKNVPTTGDFTSGAITAEILSTSKAVHFQNLGIAVISGVDEIQSISASMSDANNPVQIIEPEYIAYLSSPIQEYLRGYKEAVNHLYDILNKNGSTGSTDLLQQAEGSQFRDNNFLTWGLQATKVHTSPYSGQGIKIAVLDTGLDFQHSDFKGRLITAESFSGETVDDVHSHGTHCIGTSCGSNLPMSGVRRYGIAYNAHIFVGKVFDNAPTPAAPTANIIAAIEWALNNDCHVASLSLGVPFNQPIAQYETPLRRALNAGLFIVAAAGNNASRPSNPGFVEPPANSESSMAVAAIDNRLKIASFSARSSQVTGDGGKVNIAAPGVNVFSSVISARGLHSYFDGTSMATPHVAGIAGLWAEATNERGSALWSRLIQSVKPLQLPSVDVGAGLVQAPQ